MIIKMSVQVLCEDVDQLLKDICDYLLDQVNNEDLTENQRKFANKLIQRSKKQLEQISKVSMALSTEVDDSSYVDMNRQSAEEVEETTYEDGPMNEYTPIVCPDILPEGEPMSCPYESSPAIELEQCDKFGTIDRKEKFLFIGHQKKFLAGIKGHWLLLYCNKKDQKPIDSLNLQYFQAKPVEGAKSKAFELTCRKTQKTFHFIAQTPKDMLQWVEHISRRSSIKEKEEVLDSNQVEIEEENVYEPLKINAEVIDEGNKTLKKSKPLPPLPSNTYIVRPPKPQQPTAEMETYDPICTPDIKPAQQEFDNNQEEIYDFIEEHNPGRTKAPPIVNRPPPPEIPPPNRYPKLAERAAQDSTASNSFSEDDDEAIYDKLEQLPPSQLNQRRKPPDPEPEEEYSNLACDNPVMDNKAENPSEVRDAWRNFDKKEKLPPPQAIQRRKSPVPEPEEEYCNLVCNTVNDRKTDEPEEEDVYCNLVVPQQDKQEAVQEVKRKIVPVPPLKPKLKKFARVEEPKNDVEEEQPEYDCVIQTPDTNYKRSPFPKQQITSFLHQNSFKDKIKSKRAPEVKPPYLQK